jgi:hypothetical protein
VVTKTAVIGHWTGYCVPDEKNVECEVLADRFDKLTDKKNGRKVLSGVRNESYF